ncbi:Heat shock factor protein [Thelohanellus kitauei]|uniref:Heat shock factor protein n=1 Tax=Thelohanellus kitauei TaxID=669202 RepID=A0A0C2MP55_THEKT|nr:Heat shock factor protein [Thelohanellus kitauei]
MSDVFDLHQETIPPFVRKLWCILNEKIYEPIIRWSSDGNSVIILDMDGFQNIVRPQICKSPHFSSYIRQLNLHGFHKRNTFSEKGIPQECFEFYSPYFKRDKPHLLKFMRRNQKSESIKSDIESVQSQVDYLAEKVEHVIITNSEISKKHLDLRNEISSIRERQDKQNELMSRMVAFIFNALNNQQGYSEIPSNKCMLLDGNLAPTNVISAPTPSYVNEQKLLNPTPDIQSQQKQSSQVYVPTGLSCLNTPIQPQMIQCQSTQPQSYSIISHQPQNYALIVPQPQTIISYPQNLSYASQQAASLTRDLENYLSNPLQTQRSSSTMSHINNLVQTPSNASMIIPAVQTPSITPHTLSGPSMVGKDSSLGCEFNKVIYNPEQSSLNMYGSMSTIVPNDTDHTQHSDFNFLNLNDSTSIDQSFDQNFDSIFDGIELYDGEAETKPGDTDNIEHYS